MLIDILGYEMLVNVELYLFLNIHQKYLLEIYHNVSSFFKNKLRSLEYYA
jgi:hypothetical protein